MKRPFVKTASNRSRTRSRRAGLRLLAIELEPALRLTAVAGALLWACSSGDERPAPSDRRAERTTEEGGAGVQVTLVR